MSSLQENGRKNIPQVAYYISLTYMYVSDFEDEVGICMWPADSRYLDLAYLEVKISSLPKHENLTTGKKI